MNNKTTNKQLHFCLKPACAAVLLAFAMQTAQANPTGASVVNGQASFATTGNALTVTNTPGTIINWQGFSIGANEITRFAQQSASSAVLNRVISNNPSNILGTLQSNGRVFLVNPNGIVFGAGATIDVAGLVATSLNLSNTDFLAGRYHFTQVPGAANISNAGNITAQTGGQIYLIAPNVENTGVITAPNGEILLAAGHSVDLVNTNDPNLRVSITAPAGDATNVGQLIASSGSLGLFGTVVRNSGQVSADSATIQGGKIVFKASQRVDAGGTIGAQGVGGGTINVLADMQTGTVNVTGTLDASAPKSGNGGFIDTSAAHVQVADTAHVTTFAALGNSGTWLIDPIDFTIASGSGALTTSGIGAGTLATSLDSTSVVIATDPTTSGNGDIFVNASIAKIGTPVTTLTLQAHNSIIVAPAVAISSTGGALNVVLNSDSDASGAGAILLSPGSSIVSNGGNITLGGGLDPLTTAAIGNAINNHGIYLEGATLNSGAGNISLIGKGASGTIGWGIIAFAGTSISASGGTINLNGTAGAGPSDNRGVYLQDAGTIIQSTNGDIYIVGTGAGGGTNSVGLLNSGAQIISTGIAKISLVGTSVGEGGPGVSLNGNAIVQSANGDISITGTGSGTANSYGVWLDNGASVISTGSAAIILEGTGASGNAGILAAGIGPNMIGGPSATGLIRLTALTNDISLSAVTIQTSGSITAVANNAGNITLNSGSTININAGTGNIAINADGNGDINLNGNLSVVGGSILVRTLSGNLNQGAASAITTGTAGSPDIDNVDFFADLGNISQAAGATITSPDGLVVYRSATNSLQGLTDTITGGTTGKGLVWVGRLTPAGGPIVVDIEVGPGAVDQTIGSVTANYGVMGITNAELATLHTPALLIGDFRKTNLTLKGATPVVFAAEVDTVILRSNGIISQDPNATITVNNLIVGAHGFDLPLVAPEQGVINLAAANQVGTVALETRWVGGDITFNNTGAPLQIKSFDVSDPRLNYAPYGAGDYSLGLGVRTAGANVTITNDGPITVLTPSAAGNVIDTTLNGATTGIVALNSTGAGDITVQDNAWIKGGTINVLSSANILLNGTAALTTTGGNVRLNSDSNGVGGGNIQMNAGSSIVTNGGNITLGGGSTPLTTAAVGSGTATSADASGIYLDAATLNAGGGNISLLGAGVAGTTFGADGIYVTNGSVIQTTTGTITLNGTGGAGTDSNSGVRLGTSASISSVDGAISITGQGAGSGASNYGLYIHNGATVGATGLGAITLNGTGSVTGTSSNTGIRISASGGATQVTSASGDIFMTGIGGPDGDGLQVVSGAVVQSASGTLAFNGTSGTGSGVGVYIDGTTVNAAAASVNADSFMLGVGGTWNQVAATLPSFTVNDFRIAGGTFIRALGGNGSGAPYRLADIYGVQGMGSAGMLGNAYVLANNINASGTVSWNAGAGFMPVGTYSFSCVTCFTGTFDGLGHTISNLTINRPTTDNVGLFGYTEFGSSVRNVGMVGGSVSGNIVVGGLVGNNNGIVSTSYATDSVSGVQYIGGLVGSNFDPGSVSNSYAIGSVSGTSWVGGLAGRNGLGNISNSYATGSVVGVSVVGGLVGYNYGTVSGYWDIQTSGQATIGIGGGTTTGATGLTTAQMMTQANFTSATIANGNVNPAWDFTNIWYMIEGNTYPLFRYSQVAQAPAPAAAPNTTSFLADLMNMILIPGGGASGSSQSTIGSGNNKKPPATVIAANGEILPADSDAQPLPVCPQ